MASKLDEFIKKFAILGNDHIIQGKELLGQLWYISIVFGSLIFFGMYSHWRNYGESIASSIIWGLKWSIPLFIVLWGLLWFGYYLARKKINIKYKKIIAIGFWILAIIVFILPFFMVYVLGKK